MISLAVVALGAPAHADGGPGRSGAACSEDSDCGDGLECSLHSHQCTGYTTAKTDDQIECNVPRKRLLLCRNKRTGVLMVIPANKSKSELKKKPRATSAKVVDMPVFPCESDDACHDYAERANAEAPEQFSCKKGVIRKPGGYDLEHLDDYGVGPWCFRDPRTESPAAPAPAPAADTGTGWTDADYDAFVRSLVAPATPKLVSLDLSAKGWREHAGKQLGGYTIAPIHRKLTADDFAKRVHDKQVNIMNFDGTEGSLIDMQAKLSAALPDATLAGIGLMKFFAEHPNKLFKNLKDGHRIIFLGSAIYGDGGYTVWPTLTWKDGKLVAGTTTGDPHAGDYVLAIKN